jgi:hypothetical protein
MKKPFLKPTAIALLIAITFSNCATIVSKSSYPVGIDTNPAGASVSITDKKGKEVYKGTSPATVVLKSGAGFFSRAEYQVKLSLNGYDEKIIPINYKINGWYFGNILIGGVLGMLIIDPATGAMWKIETPSIDETLIKSTALTTNTPTLKIVDIKDVPQVMKDQLVKIK